MAKFLFIALMVSQLETALAQAGGSGGLTAPPGAAQFFQAAPPSRPSGGNIPPAQTYSGVAASAAAQARGPVRIPVTQPNISNNDNKELTKKMLNTLLGMYTQRLGKDDALIDDEPNPAYNSYWGGSSTYRNEYGPAVNNDYSGLQSLRTMDGNEASRYLRRGHKCSDADTDRLVCMVCNLYFEAGNEPEVGQVAVARSVMTRVFSGAYEPTVCGNVYKKSQNDKGKWVAQYSWTLENKDHTLPNSDKIDHLIRIASEALKDGPNGYTNYFAQNIVTPYWYTGNCRSTAEVINNHTFCTINGTSTRSIAEVAAAEGLTQAEVAPQSPEAAR